MFYFKIYIYEITKEEKDGHEKTINYITNKGGKVETEDYEEAEKQTYIKAVEYLNYIKTIYKYDAIELIKSFTPNLKRFNYTFYGHITAS